MKTLIKHGTLFSNGSQNITDLLIENGIVTKIAPAIGLSSGTEFIDASGCYLWPGGIDPHVHMQLPTPAGNSSDDFFTGSRAALLGGTTTLIDFVTPKRGYSILEALALRKTEAANALTDYSLHVSPVEFTKKTENELMECIRQGVRSFKVYMAYKTNIGLQNDELMKVLRIVGKHGGIVAAHCEMGDRIEVLRNRFFMEGKTQPVFHALSRPPETESDAVKLILEMAAEADCAVYLVHISTAKSLEHIRKAQNAGKKVYAETCPQYLILNESLYEGTFNETAPFVISPPLRTADDNEALWQALADGTLQTVGTDHCPFNLAQKSAGALDFRQIPNGAGGVEHRLEILFTYGVLKKRISMERMIELIAGNPAKIFGLYPQKGMIAEGSDADLVIWNPKPARIISASKHHQHCDHNIYEGLAVRGKAEYVLRRGTQMVSKGKIVSESRGKYLAGKGETVKLQNNKIIESRTCGKQ